MGQIQNAILNTLGSAQQMAQLYKFTDAYVKQQEDKANQRAEKAAKQEFEDLKKEYERNQTVEQVKAKIHAEPYSEEETAKYKEFYKRFYDKNTKDGDLKAQITKEKQDLTNLIKKYKGDINSDEYRDFVRRRQWLDDTKDFNHLYKGRSGKAKAQKSPQEQADTNGNIEKAKNTAKGGKK